VRLGPPLPAVGVQEGPAGCARSVSSFVTLPSSHEGASARVTTATADDDVLEARAWSVGDAQSALHHGEDAEPRVDLESHLPAQIALLEHLIEQVTDPPPPGEVDDRLVQKITHVHVVRPTQPVPHGARHDQRCAQHRLEPPGRTGVIGQGRDGEIHLPLGDESHEVLRAVVQDVHLHSWVALLELPDLHHVDASRDGNRGDPDRPAQQALDLGDSVPPPSRIGDRGSGRFEQRTAGVGRLGSAPPSGEQLRPQLAFEPEERRRQARLPHVQTSRGRGERAFLHDRQAVLELPQLHPHRLPRWNPSRTRGETNGADCRLSHQGPQPGAAMRDHGSSGAQKASHRRGRTGDGLDAVRR
jgi:hypothetical protein